RRTRTDESGRAEARAERGDTLIEILVSVVIMGLVGAAVLGALMTAARASAIHRVIANAEVAGRSFAGALADTPYIPCATPADYAAPLGYVPDGPFDITVTSVERWSGDIDQADFAPFGDGCATATIADEADSGLQRISYA